MAESGTLVALRTKRGEIESQIVYLEGKLAELRATLSHVSAVVHLYESDGDGENPAPYRIQLGKVIAHGEYLSLSLAALRERSEPMSTGDLALYIMARKGWNAGDLLLRRSLVRRISDALGKALKRGTIRTEGIKLGARVWVLPGSH